MHHLKPHSVTQSHWIFRMCFSLTLDSLLFNSNSHSYVVTSLQVSITSACAVRATCRSHCLLSLYTLRSRTTSLPHLQVLGFSHCGYINGRKKLSSAAIECMFLRGAVRDENDLLCMHAIVFRLEHCCILQWHICLFAQISQMLCLTQQRAQRRPRKPQRR